MKMKKIAFLSHDFLTIAFHKPREEQKKMQDVILHLHIFKILIHKREIAIFDT